MIRFETSLGAFTIELFDKDAPVTVQNFRDYVDAGHFDGTVFHRVIWLRRSPWNWPTASTNWASARA